nr:hypothetical protein KPHV_36600 [Kitasatospora purpeofusca]
MVIAVIGYGPDHGFCNAGVARSDERDEARTGGGPLTNPAGARDSRGASPARLVDRRMHNRRLRREVTPRESWARTSPGRCSTRRAFAPDGYREESPIRSPNQSWTAVSPLATLSLCAAC